MCSLVRIVDRMLRAIFTILACVLQLRASGRYVAPGNVCIWGGGGGEAVCWGGETSVPLFKICALGPCGGVKMFGTFEVPIQV